MSTLGARSAAVRLYRPIAAVAVLFAVSYQAAMLAGPGWSATDYFSYFTELSNLFAGAVFLAGTLIPRDRRSRRVEMLRGACVVYMLTTGVVYAVLLSGGKVSLPWVNTILHRVMPLLVAADWLLDPPVVQINPGDAAKWLAFPGVWCAYTLVRGPFARWYPYFFIDPRRGGGYVAVAVACVAIGIGIVTLSLAVARLGNRLGSAHDAGRGEAVSELGAQ